MVSASGSKMAARKREKGPGLKVQGRMRFCLRNFWLVKNVALATICFEVIVARFVYFVNAIEIRFEASVIPAVGTNC